MVKLDDLTPIQKHRVMGSDRYSIRGAEVYDDVAGRFVTADDIGRDNR